LRSDGHALGVVQAWQASDKDFRQPEVDLLAALCAEASIGLENVRLRAKLAHTAATDHLTKLPNRREFERLLGEEIRRCNSRNTPLALVLMDVDHFKSCNDERGHAQGDEVLKALSAAINGASTEKDSAARYGGDEFGLLLPGKDPQQAAKVVQGVRSGLSKRLKAIDEGLSHMTVSAGIGCHHHGEGADELVQEADRAVFRAKRLGRNRVCLAHDPAPEE
jgi:diguanylate cyclase (GGDEF)-like protein